MSANNLYGLELLDSSIRAHPYLKSEDHQIIHNLCKTLGVSESPGDINSFIREQLDAEASAVYLLTRYTDIVDKLKSMLNEQKAGEFFTLGPRDEEGLKWTRAGKEEYLLATNTKYIGQVERLRKAENLLLMIKGLYTITFNRDRKLEQLSINYRRELEGDNRA